MSSDKIQVANLKDAFSDLNIPLRPKEQQMLEKTLNADGTHNHCQSVCLNKIVLLRSTLNLINTFVCLSFWDSVYVVQAALELCIPGYLKLLTPEVVDAQCHSG